MSVTVTDEKTLKKVSKTIDAVKGQAEELKSFAENNGVNIIILMADQKCYEPNKLAMCQIGHVNHKDSDLQALYGLHENLERANDILESKIMKKMIDLQDTGKLDIKLSKEDLEKMKEIKQFFEKLKEDGE